MIIEINGDTDTGKTKLALSMIKDQYKENCDAIVVYLDSDLKMTLDRLQCDIDEKYINKLTICKGDKESSKGILEYINSAITSEVIDMFVIDSVHGLGCNKKDLIDMLDRMTEVQSSIFILINQIRTKPGDNHPTPMYNEIFERYCDFRYYINSNKDIIKKKCDNDKFKKMMLLDGIVMASDDLASLMQEE